jgi:hypothetical protein
VSHRQAAGATHPGGAGSAEWSSVGDGVRWRAAPAGLQGGQASAGSSSDSSLFLG